MPDKRMRPIVKQEPGADGAQELPPPPEAAAAAAAAAREREGRRRRGDMGEEGAGTELEVQLLRANAEAQAFALQGMERERAMAEQLLQAKEQLLQSCRRISGSKTPRSRLLCTKRRLLYCSKEAQAAAALRVRRRWWKGR
jgi:hypothetical protein